MKFIDAWISRFFLYSVWWKPLKNTQLFTHMHLEFSKSPKHIIPNDKCRINAKESFSILSSLEYFQHSSRIKKILYKKIDSWPFYLTNLYYTTVYYHRLTSTVFFTFFRKQNEQWLSKLDPMVFHTISFVENIQKNKIFSFIYNSDSKKDHYLFMIGILSL